MTMLDKEADEFFRTTPDDIEVDGTLQAKLDDFEEQHLSERERKLIQSQLDD